jgi:Spy/CpxP family protein refolding chaperone
LDSDINAMLSDKQKLAYKQLKADRKAERKAKREQKTKEREEMDEIEGIF